MCRAVEHAHRKLILHRDIKPGNILVDADGRAMLLDFGIAKPMAGFGQAVEQTRSALAFTPDYAAPEQIRGEPVGTPADVHALGAVLYELLTGQRAFVSQRQDAGRPDRGHRQHRRHAQLAAVARPAPQRLLAGDLDQIVLKAVHPDCEQRYATAAALADDLERWLAGQPVTRTRRQHGLPHAQVHHPTPARCGCRCHGGTRADRLVGSARLAKPATASCVVLGAGTDAARTSRLRLSLRLVRAGQPAQRGSRPPSTAYAAEAGVAEIDGAGLTADTSGRLKQTMGSALVAIGELDAGRRTLQQALGAASAAGT